MVVDLRKKGDVSEVICEGGTVKRVNEYKHLGIVWVINSHLNAISTSL